jgi:hypothetical protein
MSGMRTRALWVGLFGLLLASEARAVSLALTPATSVAAVGDTVAIAIEIAGLGAGAPPTLSSFDIDVSFDPTVLGFQSAAFGSALGTGADIFTSAGLLGPGSVDVSVASLLPSPTLDATQPASFVLATLVFKALAPGVSPLAIADQLLADTSSVAGGNQIFVDSIGGARVTVAPVPEPAALLVFGAGVLLAVGAPGYRRKR